MIAAEVEKVVAAVAAVPGVEGQVEMAHEIAEIFEEGRAPACRRLRRYSPDIRR
jgi:hypothetical protein